MQDAAHIMMTLDITITFWLADSCLRTTKLNALEFHFENLWQISRSH